MRLPSRVLILACALVVALAIAPACASAGTESEPNDSAATADLISDVRPSGECTVTGSLVGGESTDTVDVFKVYLTAGEQLRCALSAAGDTGFGLRGYGLDFVDPQSSPPLAEDATQPVTYPRAVEFRVEESGYYYVCASSPTTEAGSGSYTLTLDVVRKATTIALVPNATLLVQGGSTEIEGYIELGYGSGDIPTGTVLVSCSYDGVTYRPYRFLTVDDSVGGYAWFSVPSVSGAKQRVWYQATYFGTDRFVGSASAPASVQMRATLTPVRSSRFGIQRYRLDGYLTPQHAAGTYPVRIYLWLHVNGAYRGYGYRTARAYSTTVNGRAVTRYYLPFRFPYRGKWRLRAYHGDFAHAATYSNYSYVWAW